MDDVTLKIATLVKDDGDEIPNVDLYATMEVDENDNVFVICHELRMNDDTFDLQDAAQEAYNVHLKTEIDRIESRKES